MSGNFPRLTPIRAEGKPIHPDDLKAPLGMSDEQYLRQLQAYNDQIEDVRNLLCSRAHLLEKVIHK